MDQNSDNVSLLLIAIQPCQDLSALPWTYWKKNRLILLPQTQLLAKDLKLNIDSKVYSLSSDLILNELYKINQNDLYFISKEVGNITTGNDIVTIWERRSNLSELWLNVVFGNYWPHNTYTNNDTSTLAGYFADQFWLLQEKFNFKYTLVEDGSWGSNLGNGTYSGMLGRVVNGKSNWSISDFAATEERKEIVDFSSRIYYSPRRIVTRTPNEDMNWTAYLTVFSNEFWIVTLLSVSILSVSLFLILRTQDEKSNSGSIYCTALTFTVAALCSREITPIQTTKSGG